MSVRPVESAPQRFRYIRTEWRWSDEKSDYLPVHETWEGDSDAVTRMMQGGLDWSGMELVGVYGALHS